MIKRAKILFQACAPRYIWFTYNGQRREPIGKCFTASASFGDFMPFSPCNASKDNQAYTWACRNRPPGPPPRPGTDEFFEKRDHNKKGRRGDNFLGDGNSHFSQKGQG